MHPIRFHCGNYERFQEPDEYLLITQGVQTDKVMSQTGYNILKRAEDGPVIVFSNVNIVFNGFRKAIAEANFDSDPDIKVIFYPDDLECFQEESKINRYAYLDNWPSDMFNQDCADAASIITAVSNRRKKEKLAKGKDQNQDTAPEAS